MFKWVQKAKRLFASSLPDRALVNIEDDGFMSDDISVNIEDIISDENNDDIGKLHILSLTEFHTALGDAWDKREDKIFMLTEGVLRDMISPGNYWEKRGTEVYIMLFPTLSEIEGEVRAYEIAETVGMKIIGERFDGTRRPHARINGVSPKDVLNEDGTFNLEKLEEAGRQGVSADGTSKPESAKTPTEIKSASAGGATKGPSQKNAKDWKKNQFDHENANTDWKNQHHDHDETNTDWQKRHHREGPDYNPDWEKIEQEKRKKKNDPNWTTMSKKEKTVTPASPNKKKASSRFALTFSPCWERDSQSLCIYRSVLTYEKADGSVVEGPNAYNGAKTTAQRLKLDSWLVQHSAIAIESLLPSKRKTPLILPIASSSLRGPYGKQLLDRIGMVAHDIRRNLFIIEILDDGDWQQSDLENLAKQLSQLVHSTVLRASPKTAFYLPEQVNGLDYISIDLADTHEENAITTTQLETLFKHQKKVCLFGLTQRTQISDMIDMGATLLNGPALVKNTKTLRPPFNLPIERLKK